MPPRPAAIALEVPSNYIALLYLGLGEV